jgi:hypothetical protein
MAIWLTDCWNELDEDAPIETKRSMIIKSVKIEYLKGLLERCISFMAISFLFIK